MSWSYPIDLLNYIPEWLGATIMVFGLCTIFVFIFLIINGLWEGIKELVRRFIYYIHRKTRFHRPPTAKCYCRDCDYWHPNGDGTNGICWGIYFQKTGLLPMNGFAGMLLQEKKKGLIFNVKSL